MSRRTYAYPPTTVGLDSISLPEYIYSVARVSPHICLISLGTCIYKPMLNCIYNG